MAACARPADLDQAAHTAGPCPWEGMMGAGRSIRQKQDPNPIQPGPTKPFVPLCLCSRTPNTSTKADSVLKEENHVSLIPAFDFCLDVLVQGIKVVSLMRLHIIVSQELLKGCF